MSKLNQRDNIFDDEAVFNYVSGYLEGEKLQQFEARLSSDVDLQKAVDTERQLRRHLEDIAESEQQDQLQPNDDEGLAKLFDRIDNIEQSQQPPASATLHSVNDHREPKNEVWWRSGSTAVFGAVAASFLAVVVFLTVPNLLNPVNNQEFNLLSEEQISTTPQFEQLQAQGRIAQLWVRQDKLDLDLESLFSEHDLQPQSRAGAVWIVSSASEFTPQRLAHIAEHQSVQRIEKLAAN